MGSSMQESDEAPREGVGGGASPAGDVELHEDVADVPGDSLLADKELVRDGAVRLAGCEQPEVAQ